MIQERKEREVPFSAPKPLPASPPAELSVASPSFPDSATKDSNIVPPTAVSQTTERVSLPGPHAERTGIHESTGYRHLFNQPDFTNTWADATSPAGVYPPPVQSSSGFAAAQQLALSTYVNSLSYAKSHQCRDTTFSQLGASQVSLAVLQQSPNDMTTRNIYKSRM